LGANLLLLGTAGGVKLINVAVPPPTPDLLQEAHAESLMPTQLDEQTSGNRASTGCVIVEPV